MIVFFPCMFLERNGELQCALYMFIIIISQSVKIVDSFCTRVDVAPNNRTYQSKLWRFACGCHCPGRILGINDQDPSVSETNWLHIDIFRFYLWNWNIFYKLLQMEWIEVESLSSLLNWKYCSWSLLFQCLDSTQMSISSLHYGPHMT